MILLNFSHPFTKAQLEQIEQILEAKIDETRQIPTQFDPEAPFLKQIQDLVQQVNLSPEEWQVLPLLINLPSLNIIAALLLAELHGRMGHFPSIIRLKQVFNISLTTYVVAEIINLQAVRDQARNQR